MITDAKSDTNFATGITTYTFQGVSQIACDCNFQAQFSEVKNWKPLDLVVWILYYYYGNEQWKPNGIRKTDKPCDTALGYKIDVPMNLLNDQIDEIPVIAVLATQAEGTTIIKDAKELKVKESNRIKAMVDNLKKMGSDIEELDDGMIIKGKNKLNGAYINTFNDHRIAMAFSIASLISNGEVKLDNKSCIDISFPGYLNLLNTLLK